MTTTQTLRSFHEKYVLGVRPGGHVIPEMYLIGHLTNEVSTVIAAQTTRIHIRSIALKHIYEKRNAYEYDVLINNISTIIKFPDSLYENDDAKKADFILVKQIDGALYACVIKQNAHPETGQDVAVVITAFKTTARYLAKFELIQSWKGGTPSS